VALGGTGYAVTALPRGSVGTPQLKSNAVNSSKVKDRSLKAADFGAGQLPTGAQGPTGPPGAPNPNAVNSDLLDNLDSAAFLRSGGKATDADRLDNLDSTAFLPATGKAADANTLDGLDSLAFMRGNGIVYAASKLHDEGLSSLLGINGFITLWYVCPGTPLSTNGVFRLSNDAPTAMNVFTDSGNANPAYQQLAGFTSLDLPTAASGDSFFIQVQGTGGIATVQVATVHRSTQCYAQALVVRAL
jgi:hypothetical protein